MANFFPGIGDKIFRKSRVCSTNSENHIPLFIDNQFIERVLPLHTMQWRVLSNVFPLLVQRKSRPISFRLAFTTPSVSMEER